ncbi:hypothetical protein [Spirosoma sp.]|uniref:hypothetical protein n=1 Tax=Spirosoma sp. TaxID=1899569 RepID=UPI0026151CB5|nr:hypothetical protein [Spirosoma sp.]MCX6216961.1 hypothetical protein [Spirosoma sp.]
MRFKEQDKYEQLIQFALDGTAERIARNLSINLFKTIQEQLFLIRSIVFTEKRQPTFEEKNAVFISSLARNHFAPGNQYGDTLSLINYWFTHLVFEE